MTTPEPLRTTTEILQDDIAALRTRISTLEAEALTYSYTKWQRVDDALHRITGHIYRIAQAAGWASIAAFLVKVLHG